MMHLLYIFVYFCMLHRTLLVIFTSCSLAFARQKFAALFVITQDEKAEAKVLPISLRCKKSWQMRSLFLPTDNEMEEDALYTMWNKPMATLIVPSSKMFHIWIMFHHLPDNDFFKTVRHPEKQTKCSLYNKSSYKWIT